MKKKAIVAKQQKPTKQQKTTLLKPSNEKKILRYIKLTSLFLFCFLAFSLTAIFHKDFLVKLDELSLFLPTQLFFTDKMSIPGGLLSYLGTFLTQFFYKPWLGSLLLVSTLLLVQYLTVKAFSIRQKYYPMSFIPAAALLLSITGLDYVIYTLKATGHAYSNILGIITVLCSFLVYQKVPCRHRFIFSLLFIIAVYPLAGFYTLFAALIFVLHELTLFFSTNKDKYRLITVFMTLPAIVIVPLLYFYNVYTQVYFEKIYISGLPSFAFAKTELSYWLPLIIMLISLIFMAILALLGKPVIKFKAAIVVSSLVFLSTLFMLWSLSNRDENFHTELAIDRAIYDNNWMKIIEYNRKLEGEPSRMIVMATNLALQKLNIAGDNMFVYKNGNNPFKTRRPVVLLNMGGQSLFYQYCFINDCYRWCMEDLVRYGMKVQNLRYMVKCAILNKEFALAKKYNDVLRKTLFHKRWAKKYQKYIDNPKMGPSDPEFKAILLWAQYNNELNSGPLDLEYYLIDKMAQIETGRVELLELSLQFSLLSKRIELFWKRFFFYVKTHKKIPIHYQEAALLFSYLEKKMDVSTIKFDEQVLSTFREVHSIRGSEAEIKQIFATQYGKTYWYYYYFLDF